MVWLLGVHRIGFMIFDSFVKKLRLSNNFVHFRRSLMQLKLLHNLVNFSTFLNPNLPSPSYKINSTKLQINDNQKLDFQASQVNHIHWNCIHFMRIMIETMPTYKKSFNNDNQQAAKRTHKMIIIWMSFNRKIKPRHAIVSSFLSYGCLYIFYSGPILAKIASINGIKFYFYIW